MIFYALIIKMGNAVMFENRYPCRFTKKQIRLKVLPYGSNKKFKVLLCKLGFSSGVVAISAVLTRSTIINIIASDPRMAGIMKTSP